MRSISRVGAPPPHTGSVETFLAKNTDVLHYPKAKRWRMGAFLVDYRIRKVLRGFNPVRTVECYGWARRDQTCGRLPGTDEPEIRPDGDSESVVESLESTILDGKTERHRLRERGR